MENSSREWLEHMVDQPTGGLSASPSVTAYQVPELSLAQKKSIASIDARKTPTPPSLHASPKELEPPAAAAIEKNSSQKVHQIRTSQGRSQSSGIAPSWKTPSISSIPTQMSADPAELAAINSDISRMVTEYKQQQVNEEEMETTDSGFEDLKAARGNMHRSSSSGASERPQRVPSNRDSISAAATKPRIDADAEMKERKRKQPSSENLASSKLPSFSTQGSGKVPSFSTQGSEFVASRPDDDDSLQEILQTTDRRSSPRGKRGEASGLARLGNFLPPNATLLLGEHSAILSKDGWLDYGRHDPAPTLAAWAAAVLPKKTKIDEADLWELVIEETSGASLAELIGQQRRPANEALRAALRGDVEKEVKKSKKVEDDEEGQVEEKKKKSKTREEDEKKKPPLKQLSVADFATTSSPTRVLPSWASPGKKKAGAKVEAIAATLRARQNSMTEEKKEAKDKKEKKKEKEKRAKKDEKKKKKEKTEEEEERKRSTSVTVDVIHHQPSLGDEEELLEVAADRTPKKKKVEEKKRVEEEKTPQKALSKQPTPPKDTAKKKSIVEEEEEEEEGLTTRTPRPAKEEEEKKKISPEKEKKQVEKKEEEKKKTVVIDLDDEQPRTSKRSSKGEEKTKASEKNVKKEKVLLATGLSSARQEQLAALVGALGGKIVREFSEEVTHVVAFLAKGDGLANRTLKYLMGILRGCWVVSFECAMFFSTIFSIQHILGVEACWDARGWVAEADFEVKGDNYGIGGPTASRAAHAQHQPPLFHAFQFYLDGQFGTPSKEELSQLITLGVGASHLLSSRPPRVRAVRATGSQSMQLGNDLRTVVLVDKSKTDEETAKEIFFWFGEFPVTVGWVLDSISQYAVKELADYRIEPPPTSNFVTQDSQSLES